MSGRAKVCAITLNWKRCDDTLECLDSLYRSGVDDLEVIVIDNGSHDGSVERIRHAYPQVHLVENEENVGYAKAANQGIRIALEHGATHVLTINNDAVGKGKFLRTMMDAFPRHPKAGILGCKILYYNTDIIWYGGGHLNDLLGYTMHIDMDQPDHEMEETTTGFVTGCVMLIRSELFKELGLFDERFDIYAEDLDFCLRAKAKGYESWYIPEAVVYHKVSLTAGKEGSNEMTPYRSYHYAKNMLLTIFKNRHGLKLIMNVFGQLFVALPYYFILISLQRSEGGFRRYLEGIVTAFKMKVSEN